MNDKLQKLYDLYKQQGIITDATSFEKFSTATPEQQSALYNLGLDNDLFLETGEDTFKSAFQKEEPGLIDRAIGGVKSLFAEDKQDEFAKVGQVIPDALKKKEPQDSMVSPSGESSSALPSKPNADKAFVSKQDFNTSLKEVNPSLITKDEETVVPHLQNMFGDYGFKFEETGMGYDAINVTAPNGKTKTISIDRFTDKGDIESSNELKAFVDANKPKIENEVSQYDKYYKRYRSQKDIDDANKAINQETSSINLEKKNLAADIFKMKTEQEALKKTPDAERLNLLTQKKEEIAKRTAALAEMQTANKKNHERLDEAVGKYTRSTADAGTWYGITANTLTEGLYGIGAGLMDVGAYVDSKAKAIVNATDLALRGDISLSDAWKVSNAMGNVEKEQVTKGIEEGKKALKENVEFDVSEAYKKKAQENFLARNALGVVGFLPAIGASMVNPAAGYTAFFASGYDGAMEEMKDNPAFKDIGTDEKVGVAAALGFANAAIMKYSPTNKFLETAPGKAMVANILKKMGSETAAKSVQEFADNEVKSALNRGLITTAGNLAHGFATGVELKLSGDAVKESYNLAKEDEMFQFPDNAADYLKQVAESGLDMAVGSAMMGGIKSIGTAYKDNNFDGISDATIDNYKKLTDPIFRQAYEESLNIKVANGELTEKQKDAELNDVDMSVGLLNKVPDDYTAAQKRKSLGLLKERTSLEQSIEGKDKSLVKPQNERISEINNELEELSKQKREVAPAAPEAPAEATPAVPTAKPKTLDEIQDGELKDFLNSNKNSFEDDLKLDEQDYNKAKENFDKKNPIVRFFGKKPSYEQYTKYNKDRLEQLKNNPEKFVSDEIKKYEDYKKQYGEEFELQDYLDYLKEQQSKLQEENAIQKPTTEEGVLRTEQPQVELPTVGEGNTEGETTQEGVAPAKPQEVKPIEQELAELEQMFPKEAEAETNPTIINEPIVENVEQEKNDGSIPLDETVEPSKEGLSHANTLGGVAYELPGGIGLVQGFNMFGNRLYSAYKNGSRTNIDIDNFDNSKGFFSDAELNSLKELKKKIEDKENENEKSSDNPFDKQGRVASSDSVPTNIKEFVSALTEKLGVNKKIFIITDADLNESQYQKHGLFGKLSAIRSAKLSAKDGAFGVKRYMSDADAYYIYYDGKLKGKELFTVISHELGHVIEVEKLNSASQETKSAIKDDYNKWIAKAEGKTVEEIEKETRDITIHHLLAKDKTPFDKSKHSYISSFSEYFADNVSKWARTSEKPKTLVDKFFAELANTFKRIKNYLTNTGNYSESTFKWLDEMYESKEKDVVTKKADNLEEAVPMKRQTQNDSSNVDNIVKQARANGYSERAIEEFLKGRGIDESIIAKSLEKKEAATKITTNEETMPGYDKMMEDVNSEILRGLDRKTKETTIEKNVMKIVEGSEAYKNATDQQKEQITRDVKEAFGEKMKQGPSAETITGKKEKKVTVNEAQALKDQIKLEMKAALQGAKSVTEKIKAVKDYFDSVKDSGNLTRKDLTRVMAVIAKVKDEKTLDKAVNKINDIIDKATSDKIEISEKKMIANTIKEVKLAKGNIKEKRKLITDVIDEIKKSGKLSATQVNALLKRANNLNVESFEHLNKFIDYAEKIFADADYQNKLSKANAIKDSIRKLSKNKSNKYDGNLVKLGEEFNKIDPSLVDDIEKYNEVASDLEQAIKGSSMKGFKPTIEIKAADAYIEEMMKSQKEKLTESMREQVEELLGVEGSTLTYDEMIEMLQTEKKNMSEQEEKFIRSAAVKLFDTLSSTIDHMLTTGKDRFTGEPVDIKPSKEKVIRNFMEMDLTKMKIKDAIAAVDALNNFIVNQSTAKMEKVFSKYRTERRIEFLIDNKITSKALKVFRSKFIGKLLQREFGSETLLMDALFNGTSRASMVSKAMGLLDIKSNKSEAQTIARKMVVDYVDNFYDKKANGVEFNTAENNVERGMLAFVSRVRFADEKTSFNDRKSLVEQTIKNLEGGSEKEQEKARVYQEIYDKILKDSKSAEEVRSKVDKINAEAVDFWVKKWAEHYEELADVSENIHNVVLERDGFFTPDMVKRIEEYKDEKTKEEDMLDMTDSSFLNNSGIVQKKSGRLEKVTIKDALPEGKYYDFSFDNNNSSLMADALIDVKTAGNVIELSTFLNSPELKKIVTTADERKLLKDRMEIMVRNFRKKNQYNYDEVTQLVKTFNRINALGASYALGGVAAIPKQYIGPAVNTIIASKGNLPHFDVAFNKAKQDFIANSGESIANRGIMSQADIQNIDNLLQEAAKSTPEKALRLVEAANKVYLKNFLVNTDVSIAKSSWLTYYEKGLREQGIDTKNIDYSTHKINKKAAQDATRMVDRQQNISDEDLRGKIYSRTEGFSPIITKVLLPFASFRINQWLRMNTDLGILTNKTTTKEDRVDAAYSLAAFGAEVAVFNAIGLGVSALIHSGATSLKRAITGQGDDDEEKKKLKEQDEKYIKNLKKSKGASLVQDFLSPLPPLDPAFEYITYQLLDKLQSDTKEEDRINIFEPKPSDAKTWVDYVTTHGGGAGIAVDRINSFKKIAQAYMNGQIETTQYGETTVKNIREKDKKVLGQLTTLAFLNTIGVLPTEFSSIQNTIYKEIAKEASTKTEAEIIQDRAKKRESRADNVEKIQVINRAIDNATDQDVVNELLKMKRETRNKIIKPEMSDEAKEILKRKAEREKAKYKNLLGGYDSKEDLKRYDPDLYEENFGENSDYYDTHKAEVKAEKLFDKMMKQTKDEKYGYTPKPKSKSKRRNKNSDGSYKSSFYRFSSK